MGKPPRRPPQGNRPPAQATCYAWTARSDALVRRVSCPSCGAPLPPSDGEAWVTCAHCESQFERAKLRPSGRGPLLLMIIGAMVAVGVAGAGLTAALVLQSAPPKPSQVSVNVPAMPDLSKLTQPVSGVPVSRLPEMTGTFGWFELDAPGMKGGWSDFPVFDNLPWMQAAVGHWAADVRLDRLGLDGVTADGRLDLSARDDWEVDARYASPALRQMARTARQVSENVVHSEIRLTLSESRMEALISEAHGSSVDEEVPPPPELGCDLPTLMKAFLDGGMAPRPSYSLLLQWIDARSGRAGYWRWTADSMRSGDDVDAPILDPRTCKPR